jgi:hypothetical protein
MTRAPTTPASPPTPGRPALYCAWAGVALAAIVWCVPAQAGPDAARTQVYRCQGPEGAIEFRQEPCPPGTQGGSLTVEDRPTGWTLVPKGQGPRPEPAPRPHEQTAPERRPAGASAMERREAECRRKRQQVEDLDRRLRLGTSGRQGTDLRHRRGRLEDFLYEHCN